MWYLGTFIGGMALGVIFGHLATCYHIREELKKGRDIQISTDCWLRGHDER